MIVVIPGIVYDRLTAVRPDPLGDGEWEFSCACEQGAGVVVNPERVIGGEILDCGCRERERISNTPEFKKLRDRFWKHVDTKKRPMPIKCINGGRCLLWTGAPASNGRGQLRVEGRLRMAYHVAFYLAHCHWPEYILHACDNASCVNVDHLLEATRKSGPLANWYDIKVKRSGGKLVLGRGTNEKPDV